MTCVTYLEMLHEHGDYDVDKHKLSDEDKNDEEDRSNDTTDATVYTTPRSTIHHITPHQHQRLTQQF